MAVREACCRFMERQMDEMNCVGIHCFAEAHSCKVLEERSMDYILEHFSSVYQQVGNKCPICPIGIHRQLFIHSKCLFPNK